MTTASARTASDGLPILGFESKAAFRRWLAREHARSRGLWLRIGKKGSPLASITYAEALDVALCYGWIDGQKRSDDERAFLQRFTPRGPRSTWSKINREKVAALVASGEMQPAGLAEVERAKADGRWDAAYSSPRNAVVPDDLQAALDASPKAKAFFATVSAANRYAILWRLETAKRPETRLRRLNLLVAMLERGETIH